jgi:type IV secretion system protein VirB4
MSAFFSGAFNNFLKKLSQSNTSSSFTKLNSDLIPYACLLAPDVAVTKNGEVFQIIKIDLNDFKQNQEGGLRKAIRSAISDAVSDFKTSFWIQTVKRKNNTKNSYKEGVILQDNPFITKVLSEYEINLNQLNNYSTFIYITIFRQSLNLSLSPKHILEQLSSFFLLKKHNAYINSQIEELRKITGNIINALSNYNASVLGVVEEQGRNYSEIIESLHFLVNFSHSRVELEEVDISTLINKSTYFVANGVMAIKNIFNEAAIKFLTSFSIKEIPVIPVSVISDILSISSEMIVTEYISFVTKQESLDFFKDQVKLVKLADNPEFRKVANIDFLVNSEKSYCKSSISFTIVGDSYKNLIEYSKNAVEAFSKYGIVAAREDICLQKNYLAIMPGNFHFVHRTSIHDATEVATFAYSYTPVQQDQSIFFSEKELFKIGTLRNNPFSFGLLKNNPNVLISGSKASGKTVMTNFLALNIVNKFNSSCYIIDFCNKSKSFIESISGQYYQVSLNRQSNTANFNPLILPGEDKIRSQYLTEFFTLLLASSNVVISPEIIKQIEITKDEISKYYLENKSFAIHDIRSAFKENILGKEIQSWHSVGKYYHIFDNRQDCIINNQGSICIHIDKTITENTIILASIINHIVSTIIEIAKTKKEPSLLIIQEPFLAFNNGFFKAKLSRIIEIAKKNNIFIIFNIESLEKESATIVDFSEMINSCGTQIHFGNKQADDNYGRIFRMQRYEYLVVKTLSQYEHAMLIKQKTTPQDTLLSCKFDLSAFNKTLQILSDNSDIRAKILSIKEELQTEAPERWLPAFYEDFVVNQKANLNIEEELKSIHEVKRIIGE